jgi:hypothetical protein
MVGCIAVKNGSVICALESPLCGLIGQGQNPALQMTKACTLQTSKSHRTSASRSGEA